MGCKKSYKSLHEQDRPSLLELPRVSAPVDTRNKIPIKRISPTQMEDRKKKDLCYNCDDKRALGHRCKNATLFLLEGIEMVQDSSCEEQLIEIEDGVTIARVQEEEIDVEITLYALVGSPIPGTMRVKRRIKTVSLVILVNSGISHNFIIRLIDFNAIAFRPFPLPVVPGRHSLEGGMDVRVSRSISGCLGVSQRSGPS